MDDKTVIVGMLVVFITVLVVAYFLQLPTYTTKSEEWKTKGWKPATITLINGTVVHCDKCEKGGSGTWGNAPLRLTCDESVTYTESSIASYSSGCMR